MLLQISKIKFSHFSPSNYQLSTGQNSLKPKHKQLQTEYNKPIKQPVSIGILVLLQISKIKFGHFSPSNYQLSTEQNSLKPKHKQLQTEYNKPIKQPVSIGILVLLQISKIIP